MKENSGSVNEVEAICQVAVLTEEEFMSFFSIALALLCLPTVFQSPSVYFFLLDPARSDDGDD